MNTQTATQLCSLYNRIVEATNSRSWFELKEKRLGDLRSLATEWVRIYDTLTKHDRKQHAIWAFHQAGLTPAGQPLIAEKWKHLYSRVQKWFDDAGVELAVIWRRALAKSERSAASIEAYELDVRGAVLGATAYYWDPIDAQGL
jgi:hypothetical protein